MKLPIKQIANEVDAVCFTVHWTPSTPFECSSFPGHLSLYSHQSFFLQQSPLVTVSVHDSSASEEWPILSIITETRRVIIDKFADLRPQLLNANLMQSLNCKLNEFPGQSAVQINQLTALSGDRLASFAELRIKPLASFSISRSGFK